VHHAQNDIYLDRNYVGVFMIWDHIFGTYQEELDEQPCIYGIRGQLFSWNPLWANWHYYWAMAKDAYHAENWLDKVRVWFKPPGWRPADVEARYPKKDYDPLRDFQRFDPQRPVLLSVYVFVQFLILMAANSQFLALLPLQSTTRSWFYFLLILATLVTLGGLLENRREFALVESARLVGLGLGVFVAGGWFGTVVGTKAIAGLAVYSLVSLGWLWIATNRASVPALQSSISK
jgi:sterol desaturase/sphingolipid hydroxylase (fatty acid hydroxylase superfamily)